MDQQAMIDDLVRMLDAGAQEGVGHINVAIDASRPGGRKVQTGCCLLYTSDAADE